MNKSDEKLLVGYWLKLYLADYLPIIKMDPRIQSKAIAIVSVNY